MYHKKNFVGNLGPRNINYMKYYQHENSRYTVSHKNAIESKAAGYAIKLSTGNYIIKVL